MIAAALTLTEKREMFFEKREVFFIIVHHSAYSVSIQFRWWHGVSVACHGVVDCYESSLSINVLLCSINDGFMMDSMGSIFYGFYDSVYCLLMMDWCTFRGHEHCSVGFIAGLLAGGFLPSLYQ